MSWTKNSLLQFARLILLLSGFFEGMSVQDVVSETANDGEVLTQWQNWSPTLEAVRADGVDGSRSKISCFH
jgi:hypothetical protein